MKQLSLFAPEGFPEVGPGDVLPTLILDSLAREAFALAEGDIVVLAQKVVSKSEDRFRTLAEVQPTAPARELASVTGKDARVLELMLRETAHVLRAVPGVVVVEDRRGFVLANAGIDASNVPTQAEHERVLLLPEDPDRSAAGIRQALEQATGARLGVVINDSWGRAWRNGTVGTALGVSGLPALLDLRGTPDRDGRALQTSELALADEVAAAASMLMGQAGEGRPVVVVRGVGYCLREGCARELLRPRDKDLFR